MCHKLRPPEARLALAQIPIAAIRLTISIVMRSRYLDTMHQSVVEKKYYMKESVPTNAPFLTPKAVLTDSRHECMLSHTLDAFVKA